MVATALRYSHAVVQLQNKISDSRDSLKDTKADIDKRGVLPPLVYHRCDCTGISSRYARSPTLHAEHRLSKLRRAVEDASTEYAVADSKKMHLNARLQQDDDEVQALKDKVRLAPFAFPFPQPALKPPVLSPSNACRRQATQIKQVLATGAISGAQKLAQMAGKAKTQLQQTEAAESKQQGGERAMIERYA